MHISPGEAEEALVAIQQTMQKTRRSIASSGAYIFLIITGTIWLIGFLSTQFLPGEVTAYVWAGTSILGTILAVGLGVRINKRVRPGPSVNMAAKRASMFWLLLAFYCVATIAVARPTDGKQITMFILLFIMVGQLAMGLLLSFASIWWTLPITALALMGYFLLPDIFYLWMALLVGGGMILLGLYIRMRW